MTWLEKLLEAILKAIADWITRCIPVYNPAAWNDANGIEYNNNCYNYGCDIQTGTYAQPGSATGNQYNNINCLEVGNGAQSDGLVPVNCDEGCGCRECCHQVALVIAPGFDYHWYRKDRDGRWSHKMGGSPATNLDNSNNIITDPRTADRGAYTVFCGCYCVCKAKVTIN
jgi:hypothetical protein